MKKKFLSLLICLSTSLTFVSTTNVNAQTKTNTNNTKVECRNEAQSKENLESQKSNDEIYIETLKESESSYVGNKEIANPPKYVRGILSNEMETNFDNIFKFFEKNKNIFKINDPQNQLTPLRDSGNVFRLAQMVDGMPTDNTYIVVFNDNNQIEMVNGTFDNALYEKNSPAKVAPRITQEQAFEIAKKDLVFDIVKSNTIPNDEKSNYINEINNLTLSNYGDLELYVCKCNEPFGKGPTKYHKTYKIDNLGCYDMYVSVTTGRIVSKRSTIFYNK